MSEDQPEIEKVESYVKDIVLDGDWSVSKEDLDQPNNLIKSYLGSASNFIHNLYNGFPQN